MICENIRLISDKLSTTGSLRCTRDLGKSLVDTAEPLNVER